MVPPKRAPRRRSAYEKTFTVNGYYINTRLSCCQELSWLALAGTFTVPNGRTKDSEALSYCCSSAAVIFGIIQTRPQPLFFTIPDPSRRVTSWLAESPLNFSCRPLGQ